MKKHLLKTVVAVIATCAMLFSSCDKHHDGNYTVVDNPTSTSVEWIDLGLPSGLLWATCNLGATAPEKYGDYYAWGETTTKSDYSCATYRYCNGNDTTMTKYCDRSDCGYNGFTDALTTLEAIDDAATQVLGNGARIPTAAEWQELIANTTAEWTTVNGVNGSRFTAANGNSIFLPAAGYRSSGTLYNAGGYGNYWSASLYETRPISAWYFAFGLRSRLMNPYARCLGSSVRAVRDSEN